jgi:prevent-host-death family protein
MVSDHSNFACVDTIAISKFKAQCLAVLEQVRKTGKPIRITRRGMPIADVLPPAPESRTRDWLGQMAGTATVKGDIVAPSSDLVDWDADHG